jgi:uncharacterized membrane protein YeaQ/YmgE (transglycosylase-associated protein family)
MTITEQIRSSITNNTWKYALPVGLISSSYVLLNSWQHGSESLNFAPVFFVGLIAGLLIKNKSNKTRRIGFQTGVVGSLPVLWYLAGAFLVIPSFQQPTFVGVLQAVLVLVGTGLAVVLVGLLGVAGALIGAWLSEKFGTSRPSVAGN